MSFALKSIELNNIRAHGYFLFEPAIEGITAISGDNGAGKSTIVDAFAWCLYGTRPSGVKNKNLIKDGVDPKDKPVSVRSIIASGGVEYSIERKIITAQGTTECNVWGKTADSEEYKHIAGPGVSHVEKFIRNELGMNEKGFLTSILIQQKQVDQIVSASPRERGMVIEELTGIASITQAIAKTNENTRALEKATAILRVGNVDEAKEKVETQEKICEEIEEQEAEAIKNFNELKLICANLKAEFDKEDAKVKNKNKMKQDVKNIEKQISFLKKQAEEDLKCINEFKSKYKSDNKDFTLIDKKTVENKRTEVSDLTIKMKELNNQLNIIKKEIELCQLNKKDFNSESKANSNLNSLKSKLSKIEDKIKNNNDNKNMLQSEIKHSNASLEHIDGSEKNCPVCKSDILDPIKLKNNIEKDIKKYEKKLSSIEEKTQELKQQKQQVTLEISDVELALSAIIKEKNLKEKESNVTKDLKQVMINLDKNKQALNKLEVEYETTLKIQADKNALKAAEDRLSTVHKTINENEIEKESTIENIGKLEALSDEELLKLNNNLKDSQENLTNLSIKGRELRGRKMLELERLGDYKENLTSLEDAVEQYNKMSEQIEISSAAASMLVAFKADRIENAIPTLEFFASDFLSKFTGGTFTKLMVDEKFNTFVTTSDGVIRPVAQLSGGELSSAAIALRLGIAMLLNSSEKNVLILDEVLVSMDEDRSRQIMETIGSMTNSQVIFIAHNTDINSVADKTVVVSK